MRTALQNPVGRVGSRAEIIHNGPESAADPALQEPVHFTGKRCEQPRSKPLADWIWVGRSSKPTGSTGRDRITSVQPGALETHPYRPQFVRCRAARSRRQFLSRRAQFAMKTSVLFWALCLTARTCFGTEPTGEFVELHSCDLYTGGCTASSESTLLGRQLLRVWAIRQGTWNHQDLADLKVAVLEVGSGNLAEKEGLAEKAEIYVPKGLDTARKEALLSWVTSQGAMPASARVLEGEISYERSGAAADVAVGDSISLL